MFHKSDRLNLFVDGMYFTHACKSLGIYPDYTKLRSLFAKRSMLRHCKYYARVVEDDAEPVNKLRPVLDFLAYNGFSVTEIAARRYDDGSLRTEGSLDVEMTVDMLRAAKTSDHIVLVSGSGSFISVIEELQRAPVKVSVLATRADGASMSETVRRTADSFIEISDLRDEIHRSRAA